MVTPLAGAALSCSPVAVDGASRAPSAPARNPGTAAAEASGAPGVSVSLSDAAKALLDAKPDDRALTGVVAAGRKALDALLAAAKATSALKDGRPTIDVSGLDRRTLWAIATNREGAFPLDEQVVATLKMQETRDAALAGPAATARITGDYSPLYRAALASLDAAGPEEKAASQWTQDRAAVLKGLDQATAQSGPPGDIPGDPVAAYLKASGSAVFNPATRDIRQVTSDVRTVLDRQYASGDSDRIDFSRFDSRSLSAVALNVDTAFSDHEIAQAAAEVRSRNFAFVSGALGASGGSGDATAFGRSLVTRYASMSSEERDAAGWTPEVYDRIVALQAMSSRLAAMFDQDPAFNPTGQGLLSLL